jgi:hypothetical protein
MTNEMVQFSDLNCFKELPTYMLQAMDMQILRSFKQEFEDFYTFLILLKLLLRALAHYLCCLFTIILESL